MSLAKISAWKPTPPAAKPADAGDATPATSRRSKADLELDRRVQALEADKLALRNRAKIQTIREVANALGIPGNRIKALVNNLVVDLGDRIQLDDENNVAILDDLKQPKSVKDYLTGFLKTEEGEMYRPAAKTASGPGLQGNAGDDGAKSDHPFAKLNYKEIMTAAQKNPAAFRQYKTEHGDEFDAKKRADIQGA